jgi:dolichyl-phosphate-mannose--protein O-mannosyl transferase
MGSARGKGRKVKWIGLILLWVGLVGVFVLWDLLFCGGKRCKQVIDRLTDPR